MKIDIIFSSNNNWFYRHLAGRLHQDLLPQVTSRLISVVDWMAQNEPVDHVVVVNWGECKLDPGVSQSREISRLAAKVSAVPRKTLIAAESTQERWYSVQFEDSIEWTEIIDVGWFEQENSRFFPEKYRFLFGGLTKSERATLEKDYRQNAASIASRQIPWAFIGNSVPERIPFVEKLISWQAAGFLFLPTQAPATRGSGRFEKAELYRILSQTQVYIWKSHHGSPHYESFRAVDGILCGAIPIKIDEHHRDCFPATLTFGTLEEAQGLLHPDHLPKLYLQCAEFLLGKNTFADEFTRILSA